MEPTEQGLALTQEALGAAPVPATPRMIRADNYPKPPEQRQALVEEWLERVKKGEHHWKLAFDRMREDMDFAAGKQWEDEAGGLYYDRYKYTLNIVLRHIKQRVSALYARDPKVIASRKHRLDFRLWDEKPESLMMAQQQAMMEQQAMMAAAPQVVGMGGPPPPSPAQQLLADVQEGMARRQMLDRVAKTLEKLHAYAQTEVQPKWKEQLKQLVRRVETCGVGYVKVGFQRLMEKKPETSAQIYDLSNRLQTIERLQADIADGEIDPYAAETEELRLALQQLQSEPEVMVREGITWDFPRATQLIPDPCTRHLKGWVGTSWIAEWFMMTPETVKEVYGVDLGKTFTAYTDHKTPYVETAWSSSKDDANRQCKVWQIHHKPTGLVYTVVDGYCDFLEEPRPPEVQVEGFWQYFALSFNDIEHERDLYPPSDVRLLRSPQMEYNRTMEARRQHRIAARPQYVAPKGIFEDDEWTNLTQLPEHGILEIAALQQGQRSADIIGQIEKAPIDPNLYEVETLYADVARGAGASEAVMGNTPTKTSATGESIAEGARVSTLAANADDLDEFLSDVARASGQVMLREYSPETVTKIVGPGAVWPQLTQQDIVEELYLKVEAGSSGRPNKEQEIANFERLGPLLIQLPGMNPVAFTKHAIKIMDDRIDPTDFLLEGMPSIVAQNAAQRPAPADPNADPNAQGKEGGDKQARPDGPPQQGGQPAMPAGAGPQAGGQVAGRS